MISLGEFVRIRPVWAGPAWFGLWISGNHLCFPTIPTRFNENIEEKSQILANFNNILQKSRIFNEILQNFAISAKFKFGAVQKNVDLVHLEIKNAEKRVFRRKNQLRYSLERAV